MEFTWKDLIESAQPATLGRLFQIGVTLGKKEYLYALIRVCKNMHKLIWMLSSSLANEGCTVSGKGK